MTDDKDWEKQVARRDSTRGQINRLGKGKINRFSPGDLVQDGAGNFGVVRSVDPTHVYVHPHPMHGANVPEQGTAIEPQHLVHASRAALRAATAAAKKIANANHTVEQEQRKVAKLTPLSERIAWSSALAEATEFMADPVRRARDHGGGGDANTLRDYWSNHPTKHGKVSGITWGIGGDFMQCVARVSKFMPPEKAKGYCALRHHQATGAWPGHAPAEKAEKAAHSERIDLTDREWVQAVAAEFGEEGPERLDFSFISNIAARIKNEARDSHGRWTSGGGSTPALPAAKPAKSDFETTRTPAQLKHMKGGAIGVPRPVAPYSEALSPGARAPVQRAQKQKADAQKTLAGGASGPAADAARAQIKAADSVLKLLSQSEGGLHMADDILYFDWAKWDAEHGGSGRRRVTRIGTGKLSDFKKGDKVRTQYSGEDATVHHVDNMGVHVKPSRRVTKAFGLPAGTTARFDPKELMHASEVHMADDNGDDDGKVDCPVCKGSGKIRDGHVTCPGCKGKGQVTPEAKAKMHERAREMVFAGGGAKFDPDGDGDDDSSPETDTDHDVWNPDGSLTAKGLRLKAQGKLPIKSHEFLMGADRWL